MCTRWIMVAGWIAALLLMGSGQPARGQAEARAEPTARPASILDDPFVREQGKRGVDLLYNMQFKAAEDIFNRIGRRYPNHPVGPFLKGLNIWWNHIMLNLEDPSHDDAFYAAMDRVIARCDRMLERDPEALDALFLKGAALGFRARLASNRSAWLQAVMDGKRAIGYVRQAGELAPQDPDYIFGKGMYDYYAAILPKHYTAAKAVTFFLPNGDREAGLSALRRAAKDGHFIQTEAVYYLLQVNYLYERNYRNAVQHVTWLRRQHPQNPYFHIYEGRVQARWGRWREAKPLFEAVLARYQAGKTGYNQSFAEQALYYLTRAQMAEAAYEDALRSLVQLDALTAQQESSTYRTYGRLRQGMVYDALDKRAAAERCYREVLAMDDPGGVHDRAEQYLETPYGR